MDGTTVAAVGGAALVVGVFGLWAFRELNRRVKEYMRAKLGYYFEYAAMLYWSFLSLIAFLFFLLFLVPFAVWLVVVLAIVVVGAVIMELAC